MIFMTEKQKAFQAEIRAVAEKYGAKLQIVRGYYEEDQDYYHIVIDETPFTFDLSDLFEES